MPHLTDRARRAMVDANRLAQENESEFIGSLFIVIASIHADNDLKLHIPGFDVSPSSILNSIGDLSQHDKAGAAKQLIADALILAQSQQSSVVDTRHILLAAMNKPDNAVSAMLVAMQLNPHDIAAIIEPILPDSDA